jgi:hypothetical protein
MAQYNTHERDLYVLPESPEEAAKIIEFMKHPIHNLGRQLWSHVPFWQWSYSDVAGQSWYGKSFIEIPFGSCLLAAFRDNFPTLEKS